MIGARASETFNKQHTQTKKRKTSEGEVLLFKIYMCVLS